MEANLGTLSTADELALLLGCAEPADSLARLVYADWLDEHDQAAKALYLRLAVATLDPAPISYRHDLYEALADQSRLVPGRWRTAFDPGTRYVVFVSYEAARRGPPASRRVSLEVDHALQSGAVRADQFSYVYLVSVRRGQVYLVSRVRIPEYLPADESRRRYTDRRPLTRRESRRVTASESEPRRYDRVISHSVLTHFRFTNLNGKRSFGIRFDDQGLVTNAGCLNGWVRLAPRTAFLFDALLNDWPVGAPEAIIVATAAG